MFGYSYNQIFTFGKHFIFIKYYIKKMLRHDGEGGGRTFTFYNDNQTFTSNNYNQTFPSYNETFIPWQRHDGEGGGGTQNKAGVPFEHQGAAEQP